MNKKAKARKATSAPAAMASAAVGEPTFTIAQVRSMMAVKTAIVADDFAHYERAREQYLRHFLPR